MTPIPTRRASVHAPGQPGRRVGYAISIAIDAALLWLINVWPGWDAVPFLTADMADVLGWVNASIVVGVAANLMYLAADAPRLRALGDVVVTTVGIVALVVLWRVFPFVFTGQTFDWELVVQVLLLVGIIGSAIAVVVNLVKLAALARRAG